MQVVPARTPSPIIEVVFINACLKGKNWCSENSWIEDDYNRCFLGTGRKKEKEMRKGKKKTHSQHELLILNHGMELSSINKLGVSQYGMSFSWRV